MSSLETLSLAPIAVGAFAILRFVWLDSLRFADMAARATAADDSRVTPRTVQRLAMQADAARVLAETDSLPKAA